MGGTHWANPIFFFLILIQKHEFMFFNLQKDMDIIVFFASWLPMRWNLSVRSTAEQVQNDALAYWACEISLDK